MDSEHDRLITVPDLYRFIDDFTETVATKKNTQTEKHDLSRSSKHALRSIVDSADTLVSALTAGDLALQSLRHGMVSGILDGHNLSKSDPWQETPEIAEDAPVRASWSTLWSNLNDVRVMAHDNWKGLAKDDLRLLWEYGRHQNLDTLTQACRFAGQDEPEPFQIFLLATFKAGYAVAVAQALWRFRNGRRV